jgi:rRNA-processing protein FCF1
MELSELVIVAVLLVLLAEVTYILAKLPKQTISKRQSKLILVDTSVLIDGRIIAVAKSGFISDILAIPRSVVGELQYLADNADAEKRARARHGLDVIAELQQTSRVRVQILQDGTIVKEGVDERLLTLAKKYNAAVCTIDYNLNKVAIVEGIKVLNINELAQSLRMAYLPGERALLELIQKGQDSHQAVGHLPDGTMVVVENAVSRIGTSVEVEFIRSLQTAAGKMMFARLVDQKNGTSKQMTKTEQPRPLKKSNRPVGTKPQAIPQSRPETTSRQKNSQSNQQRAMSHSPAQRQRSSSADSAKRPRRVDHEAALLNLVDKQSTFKDR